MNWAGLEWAEAVKSELNWTGLDWVDRGLHLPLRVYFQSRCRLRPGEAPGRVRLGILEAGMARRGGKYLQKLEKGR